MKIKTDKTQIIHNDHKICRRYVVYVRSIPDNIPRLLQYTYTDLYQEKVPDNITFDREKEILTWDYELPDCLPRSFYV